MAGRTVDHDAMELHFLVMEERRQLDGYTIEELMITDGDPESVNDQENFFQSFGWQAMDGV